MKKNSVLLEIKSLEKMIFRSLINCDKEKVSNFISVPTPTQMQILEYILNHQEEEIYQKDLENILNLRRATVSGVLQTMEKNNLIERVVASNDARVKKIILNPKTKELFLEKRKQMEELEEIIIDGISEKEIEEFLNVLNKIKGNVKNYNILKEKKKGR